MRPQLPCDDSGFGRAFFDSLPLLHSAVKPNEFLAICFIVCNSALKHKLLHRLIQLNLGCFTGIAFEVNV